MSLRVVVGGGISGVCCAQELARLNPNEEIVIVTATETLLEAKSVFAWSKYLEEIDIFEKTADQFILSNPNIRIVEDLIDAISPDSHTVHLKKANTTLKYSQLCLCTGVRPKLIADHERIVGIRDLFSVHCLVDKLKSAKKVVIVGNGGIALELAHELKCFDIDWIIREAYVGAAFFDESASDFIMPTLLARDPSLRTTTSMDNTPSTITNQQPLPPPEEAATTTNNSIHPSSRQHLPGSGLGPAWLTKTKFHDQLPPDVAQRQGSLRMHFQSEIGGFSDDQGLTWQWVLPAYETQLHAQARHWSQERDVQSQSTSPMLVITTLGEVIECDLVISATGVQPNHNEWLSSAGLSVDAEGFFMVNKRFQTSFPDIFAAGDCCHYQPSDTTTDIDPQLTSKPGVLFQPPHFFQMKLWTQARIMGTYAAQCMCRVEDDYGIDQHLELFAHVTRFFGLKVVLLGRYNAQGAGDVIEQVAKRTVLVSPPSPQEDNGTSMSADESSTCKRPKLNDDNNNKNNNNDSNGLCDLEIWSRITPGKQFIKLVVYRGKIVGALLIGDTDMEEVFENLILNQLDISSLGQALLDPDLDLADYFD